MIDKIKKGEFVVRKSGIIIGAVCFFLMSGCSLIELSGTMTKKTGEVMTDYSNNNTGVIAKMAGFGGRINTAVGASVENVARKGKNGQLGETKGEQFVEANKEVLGSAFRAAKNQPALGASLIKKAQARLKELRYYSGPINGKYGKDMTRALTNYQRAEELPITAALDKPTLSSLGIEN